MNARERFLATASFQPVDRTFILPPWAWDSTLARWRSEGMPSDVSLVQYFGTDPMASAPVQMQGPYGPHLVPPLERQVIEDAGDYLVVRDEEGNTVQLLRNAPKDSMPHWRAYPMRDREDWETFIKPRLDAHQAGRFPMGAEMERWAASVQQRETPMGIQAGSLYGWPRSFMGVERLSTLFYDDPSLVHAMCAHIADFVIEAITPFLTRVQFEWAFYWEDMAGKAGPLCSPRTYRTFMLPHLKRITDVLHAHGVHHIVVDSDGNNDVLVPLWLEAGVTGLRPFEVAAGCDAVATRRRYGTSLIIEGAIDKRALAQGAGAIEREVLSKVPWLCLQGGYFPQVDHLVPPDVPLESYAYYARLVRAVAEDPERYLYAARRKGYWVD